MARLLASLHVIAKWLLHVNCRCNGAISLLCNSQRYSPATPPKPVCLRRACWTEATLVFSRFLFSSNRSINLMFMFAVLQTAFTASTFQHWHVQGSFDWSAVANIPRQHDSSKWHPQPGRMIVDTALYSHNWE